VSSIRILPTHLVNKIAAGEVVERPASVVKELVENALDAEAANIEIRVEDGGKRLIQVIDDGCGMSAEDAALAFRPHATSKIAGERDLFAIGTLGFRGEALASIASISHAHLRTCRRQDESGCEISASGQQANEPRPCAAAPGTTVTVRDLFFNTPARRKFLRTANTEFGHICEQLARLAIPHPQVAFRLVHNGREVHNLPAVESTSARIADLFGGDIADGLLPMIRRSGEISVRGLIGSPAATRASGRWQYFFVNGRFIRDRTLTHALREAYRGLIDPNRWPVAFVFIELDPSQVDVNVHPTKIEVRFAEPQVIHGELLAALRETLNRSDLAPAAEAKPQDSPAPHGETADEKRRESLREAIADFFKSSPQQQRLNFPAANRPDQPGKARIAAPPARTRPAEKTDRSSDAPEKYNAEPAPPDLQARPIQAMQIHDSYIVAAEEDGLVIIDQHALHERIIYDELKHRLQAGTLSSQRLLIPQTFPASDIEAARLEDLSGLLDKLGIEVVPFGPGTLAVQRFATLLIERRVAPVEFMRELLDQLDDPVPPDAEQLLERILAVMACKAAVKAGEPLGQAEIDDLLARRERVQKASACPHGRPTTLKLTLADLARQFQRT